jgi:hypothetical protein
MRLAEPPRSPNRSAQQWTFNPRGSTSEIEDYRVDLNNASILELDLKPDLRPDCALASLDRWRVA